MAESRAAGGTPTYTITHEDGSAVTPQEVYDAFMRGTVILESQASDHGTAAVVTVFDYDGTPDNITGCTIETSLFNVNLGGK